MEGGDKSGKKKTAKISFLVRAINELSAVRLNPEQQRRPWRREEYFSFIKFVVYFGTRVEHRYAQFFCSVQKLHRFH